MCLQTALTVAGIGLKIVEGMQANSAAKAEARVSEQRAGLARQAAASSAQAPLYEGRDRLGAYIARTAQGNADLSQGSPLDMGSRITEEAYRKHLGTLRDGEVSAWEHKTDASNARARGRSALNGAILNGAFSLLGEASKEDWFSTRRQQRSPPYGSPFIVPFGPINPRL